MVVGMQHQQQQPHASPATVLEDATTPCTLSPLPILPSSLPVNEMDRLNNNERLPTADSSKRVDKNNAVAIISNSQSVEPLKDRVKLKDVNEYLICILCEGYFVDATSIAECLHSFCRSCIILYLSTKNFCPKCEVQINNSKPHLSLKPDKTLQDIVYKLVPGLFHAEMKRRNQFYQDKPDRDLHLHPEYRGITVDRLLYSPQDSICLSLEYYDTSIEKEDWEIIGAHRASFKSVKTIQSDSNFVGVDQGQKKYFVCPAAVRVVHLKKLINEKYCLDSKNKVELFHRRESLPNDYSLMDIAYIYAWKRNSPMKLYYRINVLTETLKSSEKLTSISAIEEKSSQLSPKLASLTNGQEDKLEKIDLPTVDRSSKLKSPCPSTEIPSPVVVNGVPKTSGNDVRSSVDVTVTVAAPVEPEISTSSPKVTITTLPPLCINKAKISQNPTTTTTTTAVHSTPKVSSKLKLLNVDNKKPKPIKNPVPKLNPIHVPEKIQASPIKSYLTISSILNEPEPKKIPIVKNPRKDRIEENKKPSVCQSTPAVITSSSTDVISTTKTPVSLVTSSLVTTVTSVTTTTKPTNSLSSIVKLLTTSASSTAVNSSEVEIKQSASSITDEPKVKLVPPVAATTTCNGTEQNKSVTTSSSTTTTNITPSNDKPTVSAVIAVTTSATSSNLTPISVCTTTVTSSISTVTVTTSTVVPSVKIIPSLPVCTTMPPLITLTTAAPTISSTYTTAVSKQPNSSYILTNTKIPSSLEISLTPTKEPKVSTSPVFSLQKMVQHNFANGNLVNGTSKVSSLEAANRVTTKRPFVGTDDGPKEKYSCLSISKTLYDDKKQLAREKKLNIQSEISVSTNPSTVKKIFSPNILPEVSITLNPHPERNKRMSPETSYDVSCFKPSEKKEISVNGVPALTPIGTHSGTICKNIQNSPIKNLNKNIKTSPRSTFSAKNRVPPYVSELDVKERKRNSSVMESAEMPKRVTLENGGLAIRTMGKDLINGAMLPSDIGLSTTHYRPQIDSSKQSAASSNKSLSMNKEVAGIGNGSVTKKEVVRHHGIPQLIDINTSQYTKMMAQNAKIRKVNYFNNFCSNLYVKPPPENTENALDLSSPSSSKSPTSDKSDTTSPDKKKLIPSVPPLMIPVTMSKTETKLSPSSLNKLERKLPANNKIERKLSQLAVKQHHESDKSTSNKKPEFRPSNSKSSPLKSLKSLPSTSENMSSLNAILPVSKAPFVSPLVGIPRSNSNFCFNQTMLQLLRAPPPYDWIYKIDTPLPMHPLMQEAFRNQPPKQESMIFNSNKK